MKPEAYIRSLRELNIFLKEHPEQRKVYRDININKEILKAKYQLIQNEQKEIKISKKEEYTYVQNRQIFDDFIPASSTPFI